MFAKLEAGLLLGFTHSGASVSTGLTVDDGRVDNNAGQVWVGHGFVQDEASDAGTSTQVMSDQRQPLAE